MSIETFTIPKWEVKKGKFKPPVPWDERVHKSSALQGFSILGAAPDYGCSAEMVHRDDLQSGTLYLAADLLVWVPLVDGVEPRYVPTRTIIAIDPVGEHAFTLHYVEADVQGRLVAATLTLRFPDTRKSARCVWLMYQTFASASVRELQRKFPQLVADAQLERIRRDAAAQVAWILRDGEIVFDGGSARVEEMPGERPCKGDPRGTFVVTDERIIYSDENTAEFGMIALPWLAIAALEPFKMRFMRGTSGLKFTMRDGTTLKFSTSDPLRNELIVHFGLSQRNDGIVPIRADSAAAAWFKLSM